MNPNKTKDFDLRQANCVIYQRSHSGRSVNTLIRRTFNHLLLLPLLMPVKLPAQDRTIDPTWLHRYVPSLKESHADLSSATCHYAPIFGAGDKDNRILRSVSRFGIATVEVHGNCQSVVYDREEEIYFVLQGSGSLQSGGETQPVRANDFTYLAPGVKHGLANNSGEPLRVLVMGVKIPPRIALSTAAPHPKIVNLDDVKEEPVQGHPTSVLYKLLAGPRSGKRDAIDDAYMITSFFWMDFAPGGTNFPHHHETAEEIYLVVDGEGEMVAGSGMDGIEGRFPAKAGDAYYFRPNCTVGFYNQNKAGAKAHILAIRAPIPISNEED
jgi:mannose-6-phosphate isomerase-like protein (cupin superfamily)